MDQAGIEWRGNNVIPPERQRLSISNRNFIRHIFAREIGKRVRTSDLHLIVDRARVNIQRTSEQIREPQHVVHLIGII